MCKCFVLLAFFTLQHQVDEKKNPFSSNPFRFHRKTPERKKNPFLFVKKTFSIPHEICLWKYKKSKLALWNGSYYKAATYVFRFGKVIFCHSVFCSILSPRLSPLWALNLTLQVSLQFHFETDTSFHVDKESKMSFDCCKLSVY